MQSHIHAQNKENAIPVISFSYFEDDSLKW